jgi:phosphohistidine phosphatase SixA
MRPKPVSAHFADPSTARLGLKRRAVLARSAAGLLLPLLGLGGLVGPAMAQTTRASKVELLATWRKSGGVLLIRHAATESGIGDPPGFVIGQCRTQRNLSEAGRQASRALGAWLQAQNFKPDAVRSSQWCRCQDTARLAFGAYEDWPALNSTFAGQGDPAAQQQALRERLQALPAGRTEVWVTHQVIMTGLTGAYPGLGEGFVVDRQGRLLARGDLAA